MKRFLRFLRKLIDVIFISQGDNKNTKDDNVEYDKKEIMEAPKLDIGSIKFHNFPENQYVRRITNKNQVVIHHTVSGKGVEGDIGWWLSQPERIATHFIIDWTGKIHQNYSTRYWGYHLGCGNAQLDAGSIAIEIDSWGALMKDDKGLFRPVRLDKKTGIYYPNKRFRSVSEDRVFELNEPFRGFTYFEKYTKEALESLRRLLVYCNETYNIPLDYTDKIWDYYEKAMQGEAGVFSHTSYRKDKSDVYPYPELVDMLKNPYKEIA